MKTYATFTSDGTSESFDNMYGNYAMSIEGDFGGGTVQIIFIDDEGNDLTSNTTDWAFTASPEFPQSFGFPSNITWKAELSGATAPNLKLKLTRYYG